ncbi:DUF4388 domain-containing protein [Pseudanabaena galeata UHCC 0370]|jgi:hypothetical protein|uniref:DUF4388 domain-containing protein n=1 Tax=Pseudanabaena galeata UHCC 0370 TaxID=3110310 RepID=A0ABU5TE11_9CYAN|nr:MULTISPECIES: DUF4388 domain-containing protein [Pseudanabaena]MEA5476283.1 DUF4388 domain-containing protein [Pseudanabaena galeata UHCC 0370]MEA5486087.1 DUF4388 domain-containing protein [Pseudanabaena sp. CCNP1317]WGS74314.1 DUF4388 domain-containing protein [Pseudanabaena galeata CCNP1313]
MAITGSLSEFSLPEIFQFLDQGQKTGILTIRDPQNVQTGKPFLRHIWLQNGRVVAAGDRLDNRGLVRLIEQRGWLNDTQRLELERLLKEDALLGLNLKSLGILQPDQLKLLFSVQVLRQVCALFQVETGLFRFDANANLPKAEMTGLSLPATETTLMGLRSLKDWNILESKLPEANSTLFNIISGQSPLRLDSNETQILSLADGYTSIKKMGEQLSLPIAKVQQIAFRLIVVGLVEEVPDIDMGMSSNSNNTDNALAIAGDTNGQVSNASERPPISNTFLQSLVGFLQHKA